MVSIQDPLWYPRMSPREHRISEACFISWRVFQGDLMRGMKTRMRRATKGLSEVAPGDAVEYHVVRDGIDEEAMREELDGRFEAVRVIPYWSSQGTMQQRLGERLGLLNTFALVATGHRQSHEGG
jgi:hypothetical protein